MTEIRLDTVMLREANHALLFISFIMIIIFTGGALYSQMFSQTIISNQPIGILLSFAAFFK